MKQSQQNNIPPGWDYNPATWGQRLPIVIWALIGFCIAGYLALYQLRIIPSVWEPFFGDGSVTILNSEVSHILPIPDAALGAFAYFIDALAGVIGGTRRWKTLPWMVILFGVAVGPLGLVSVLLVILQPVMFDSWCTLCLASGFISVIMIGPAMDEMLASLQYMQRVKHSNANYWKAFWGFKSETSKVN